MILIVSPKNPRAIVSETVYYLIKVKTMPVPMPQDDTEIGDARWVPWESIMETDCNRGLRLIRDKIKNGCTFMKKMRKLIPRSVGIIRNKKIQRQNEKKLGSYEKGERNATHDCPNTESDAQVPNTECIRHECE